MAEESFKILKYVNTGEVKSGGIETVLNSGAIGSCIVITAFDPVKHIGAMAHIMLPDSSSNKNRLYDTRYASIAIAEMLCQLKAFGIKNENIESCIVGGANVLKRENDNIGKDTLNSVKKLLGDEHLEIKVEAIGGFERRTVIFDIEMGCIYYTVGDSKQKILYQS